ncbi:putative calcium-binding protein CML19 [Dichanthelium oligosanthes]|uniref:Putative calcium-binding protein CML19 n=1 Tax=Dichanthelium oligosanthes TaxID=888268 RepID=A0A1E5W9K7_9POAL|nr:putative calcium-binding protein CML19 [Dichanthelium oligosanthes]
MAVLTSEFSRVFSAFDRDDDGKISAAELRLCMKAALGEEVSDEDAADLVASVDTDGDGLLSKEEFLKLVHLENEEEERCRGLKEAFGMYEMKGEGCITPLSLKRMLSKLGSHQEIDECKAMICRFDLNGDGVLSFEEFKIMMDA